MAAETPVRGAAGAVQLVVGLAPVLCSLGHQVPDVAYDALMSLFSNCVISGRDRFPAGVLVVLMEEGNIFRQLLHFP